MGANHPFNRAVRDDLTMRDTTRIEQISARRPRFRAFEEALVLEGTVHLVADVVGRRLTSELVDFVDQLSADRCLWSLVPNVLFGSKAHKTKYMVSSPFASVRGIF